MDACSLCGLKLPKRFYTSDTGDPSFRFCCNGCRQVYVLLLESGLFQGDYKSSELYQTGLRLGILGQPEPDSRGGGEPAPEELQGCRELLLQVGGMWCSSCSWLIEKVAGRQPGVAHARVIYASDTAKIHYRPEQTGEAPILDSIRRLGYTVQPRDAGEQASAGERRSLLIRMGVALFLMNNLMMFSYAIYVGYFQELPREILDFFPWILFGLALPAVTWCALPIHHKAWQSMRAGLPTMEVLFSMGIFAAFFYSTYEMVRGGEHFYFDTSGGLVGLLLVGKFIEVSARQKSSESIRRLYQLLPRKARVAAPEGERLVAIEKLQPGDRIIVKSGEKMPVDGTILRGAAMMDESLLTGESLPVRRQEGDAVIASSMNLEGLLEVETRRTGGDTTLSAILRLVERALTSKSGLERAVDGVTRFFIPGIIVLSILVGSVLLLRGAGLETAILRAITVLVIACPCVLGMATPLSIAAGIGLAARQGILIRDGEALQLCGKVTAAVFDKTGTLTAGRFVLRGTDPPSEEGREALRRAASLEQASGHPIARALTDAARSRKLALLPVSEVRFFPGMGIEGTAGEKRVAIGNRSCVEEAGFVVDAALQARMDEEMNSGNTVIYCGVEGREKACSFVLGDDLKPGAGDSVSQLERMGISVQLLSGDMPATTAIMAEKAGIRRFQARMLPEDKIRTIERLQQQGQRVAMIGDGVNDAPALAQADVGMAMGTGTEIAVQSSPVILLRDDLRLVPEAIRISRRASRAIIQNLGWAFLYNAVGIGLAAAGLLNPFLAAIAMLASSISVALNSMRVGHPPGLFTRRLLEILFPWVERESPPVGSG